jgi:sarcosine oxidase subunit alpha
MTQPARLRHGGRIHRDRPVTFSFNGRQYPGYEGDTLASALLANGVHMVARSWKYHRPRGIVGAGAEEPNAVVQLGEGSRTVPNARATQVEVHEGLSARSVNCWPSLEFDLLSLNGLFSRLLPAGFYYKTFMWPKSFWRHYEHFIRKAAGLGEAPAERDPDYYEKHNAHCDVLVAGAGPAGLAAALAAARSGARVIVADEQSEPGGSLLYSRESIDGLPAASWLRRTLAELATFPEVRVLARSTVFGYHDHNFLTIAERLTDHLPEDQRRGPRERVWRVRARQVILATGACERPLVFTNNDRPGVMLASAISAYTRRYGVRAGTSAVIFTNNDSAYATVLDLLDAGIQVAAVVDAREQPQGPHCEAARQRGIRLMAGSAVVDVRGRRHVQAAVVAALGADATGLRGNDTTVVDCDLIGVSGGYSPIVHLYAQSGGRPLFDEQVAGFVPGPAVQPQRSVGGCRGSFALADCLREGYEAGTAAARETGHAAAATLPPGPGTLERHDYALRPLWRVPDPPGHARGAKQFLDLQNDVSAADVFLAAREGYHSVEHVKRYTALGFGTDQGKLGNINGLAILAQALGQDIASTGTTTFRPNYTPVTFGAIAGRDLGDLFEPIRLTALHAWHAEHGAEFENVGQWKRPWYYPKPGESMHEAVRRECHAARNAVAMMDASTLGKIDIQGPDAAEFLNRVYTNNWHTLKVGQCRYGLMLREDGMVMDDGVTSRLGENHFLMTTTTGGAARVYAWLERWLQTEWPELKVYLTSVTDHWATMAVVGPRSREVMKSACGDIDFEAASFPFMSFRDGTVAEVTARVARISFSGELAYEVNVPANYARHVWEALMSAGAPHGITPYGTETMHVLRAEKGYVIVGQDTDGSLTPQDLGMEWIVSKTKDFIGRRSFARADTARTDRKQLVGLLSADPALVLPEGGQILGEPRWTAPVKTTGHVTSSYFSEALGRSIALAVLQSGRSRMGQTVYVTLGDGRVAPATITDPVFLDREGKRQHG